MPTPATKTGAVLAHREREGLPRAGKLIEFEAFDDLRLVVARGGGGAIAGTIAMTW